MKLTSGGGSRADTHTRARGRTHTHTRTLTQSQSHTHTHTHTRTLARSHTPERPEGNSKISNSEEFLLVYAQCCEREGSYLNGEKANVAFQQVC